MNRNARSLEPAKPARLVIGIDVGSTTVKGVVVDPAGGDILWRRYERHEARQAEKVRELLAAIEEYFAPLAPDEVQAFITGSGAGPLGPQIGAVFVQEVNAVTVAVETLYPEANSVVELGGQDAKIITFHDNPQTGERQAIASMNDKCASGTGATIDKCLLKVGLSREELAALRFDAGKLHRVAARCGVFAETDIVNLIKASVPADEVMNSLADAIVAQNLSVLTRGNILRAKVLLLGGPNAFLPFLPDCWRWRIPQIWAERGYTPPPQPVEELIFVPANAPYFAAYGAALFGIQDASAAGCYRGLEPLRAFIAHGRKAQLSGRAGPPLVEAGDDLAGFARAYSVPLFVPPAIEPGANLQGYIGFDGGSTTSKAVLIDETGELLTKEYMISRGNPIQDAKDILARIQNWAAERGCTLAVLGFGVTGYAADVLASALEADANIVETVAHQLSATCYCGDDIDVICDIGGQDIKVLFLEHGQIKSFRLSNQCSAGNGMLLQAMADQFGVAIGDFAAVAFKAELAPKFNYGCAVFLDTDRVNFQKEGYTPQELFAGLAQVLPKNIWQYVVQIPRLADLGHKFVLQGGTQRNLAAVKAQVNYIRERVAGAEIIVHPHSGEAGAIGAALEARRITARRGYSTFIGLEKAIALHYTTRTDETTRCRFCANECLRTFIDTYLPDGHSTHYIAGFSCEKGTAESKEAVVKLNQQRKLLKEQYPDLAEYEANLVFRRLYQVRPLPMAGAVRQEVGRALWGFGPRRRHTVPGKFQRSTEAAAARRAQRRIGIPRVLDQFAVAPFLSAYLEALGVPPRHIIFSDETTEELGAAGARYGSIDPCYPSKLALAHVHNLLRRKHAKRPLDFIWFPSVLDLPTFISHSVGTKSCPVVAGAPSVVAAAFTKEKDLFAEAGIDYVRDPLNFDIPNLLRQQLFVTWGGQLGITEDENDWACEQGWQALRACDVELERRGRELLTWAEQNDKIVLLLLGRPYHNDPGQNHQVLEEFQALGFPVLTIRSLPKDRDYLAHLFAPDSASGRIADPFDIRDVWPENYSTHSAQKVWAAKVAARHPNVAVLDLSSFKCGHDAPTYGLIDRILATSRTPHLTLHDLDANKPGGSIKIRVSTYVYTLRRYQETLANRTGGTPRVTPPVALQAQSNGAVGGQTEATAAPARIEQWWDPPPQGFARSERTTTTILFGGLTDMHDALLEAGFAANGYRVKALPCPDTESLRYGKEFGSRGQCNPAYFTVGNLIKYLTHLRDVEGLSAEEIIRRHVFLTLSSCGPCRFGMYATEYRKALRDAGFSGFRILAIKQEEKPEGDAETALFALTAGMFITAVKCLVAADVVNLMAYRVRPYEQTPGATNQVVAECRNILRNALTEHRSVLRALWRCRQLFAGIKVDWLQPKPKVALIGEFWAMTTEGEGNYRMQRFLEAQGAECEIQPLSHWVLYDLWCFRDDIRRLLSLKHGRYSAHLSESASSIKSLWLLRGLELTLKGVFYAAAGAIGLRGYRLIDMDELARAAHPYYPNPLRGGEGHMEVGKVLQAVAKQKAHLVLSVKPFGCMPSSGVSDGVQSLVTGHFPQTHFLPIETTGDGEVNAHSRVQMALFRARAKAREEFAAALAAPGGGMQAGRVRQSALCYPAHRVACTAANAAYEGLVGSRTWPTAKV